MIINLICVGKTNIPWVMEGIKTYTQRLAHYINFKLVEIADIKSAASKSVEQIKEEEGKFILSAIDTSHFVILLDEHGEEFASVEMATQLEKFMASGVKQLSLIIGGAYGFSNDVYNRANKKWSLSRLTFSHQMVRVIAVEQIYRCMTILRGEPYHHK